MKLEGTLDIFIKFALI